MRIPTLLLALLTAAALDLSKASAQELMPSPSVSRLELNTIDVLILADSGAGMTLWLTPGNPRSESSYAGRFDPLKVVQWVALAESVAGAPGDLPGSEPYLHTPPLPDRDSGQLVLYRERIGSGWGKRPYLLFSGLDGRRPFKVSLSPQEAVEFMAEMEAQARRSGLSATPSSTDVILYSRALVAESHEPPKLLSRLKLQYPSALLSRGVEGSVLVTFIILPSGRMDTASFRTLMSDDLAFTRAAYQGLREASYRPLIVNGIPTAVRVCQRVSFRN